MIQRDRNMQRMGLHSVEELPKPGGWSGKGHSRNQTEGAEGHEKLLSAAPLAP